ncbi:MAG TPA: hypothetical protein VK084_10495 [Chitinophagaceae bacterium]|nr:hypothetical protein [Chitinophagaceae bacterium]
MDIPNYPADYLFFGNRSLCKKQSATIVIRPEKRQRITNQNLYSFKHTGVIATYNAGVKIKAIQAQLRHHSFLCRVLHVSETGKKRLSLK